MKKKNYLGVFYLPTPQREHAKISEILRANAQDVKVIPIGGNAVLYLFATETKPHHISFSQVLHTGDQVFFMEIGEYTTTQDFHTVQGWLNSHQTQ